MTSHSRAFTLVESMVALAVSSLLLGGVFLSYFTLQRTFAGCGQYALNVNSGDRLLDYLSMDLRRAVRVNQGPVATVNPLRGIGTRYVITDTNVLCITIPDYYSSNSPPSAGFRSARYPYPGDPNYQAATSTTGWGQALFAVATKPDPKVSGQRTTAFQPPSGGLDELEVRYQRTTRALHDPVGSPRDQTVCIFRSEYKNNVRVSDLAREEIAEAVEAPLTATGTPNLSAFNNLSVTSQNTNGPSFLRQFGYTSRLSANSVVQNASITSTGASTVILLRNSRRD